MKVNEITKDYILFDNNKCLTYKITNPLKYDLFDYYLDFETLIHQLKDVEINENTHKFDKYNVQLAFLSNFEIYEDEIHYTYDSYRSEFNQDYQSYVDERNVGIILSVKEEILVEVYRNGENMQYPGHEVICKEFFIPFYRKTKSLKDQEIEELRNQISDIEKTSNKYLNTKYTLEDKIAAEITIQIFYDNKEVLKMSGYDGIELPGTYIHSEEIIHYDEKKAFTIKNVTEEYIEFSNGKKLTFDHESDCCEINYADFIQLDDLATETIFYENELVFESVEKYGFRFGNRGGNMIFVPCYTIQNGYYTSSVDIYYDEKIVLHVHESQYKSYR